MTSRLSKRLLPLHVAIALQGVMLWVPVEKLFMNEIGFDAATVGVMAAAYAAVVPFIEIPSGVLADRWSRRGVLIIASLALASCSLIGGLSHNVVTYIVAALVLGVYFAMYSGTLDAIVYDTVLEETGNGEAFEQRLGRVRVIESATLVASSLLGGWLAGLASTRLTYFLTVPFALLSVIAYSRFREPGLHKTGEQTSIRQQLRVTIRTVTGRGRLLPVVTLAVLTTTVVQVVFEFGPLWLVALAAPAVLYGPYWAALVSSFGLGGALAGKLPLDRRSTWLGATALMAVAGLVLTTRVPVLLVTVAQIALALVLVIAGIHVTKLLHDAVPSSIRAGVASGVSSLSWITFLPVALVVGLLSKAYGVQVTGWLITISAVLSGLLLTRLAHQPARQPASKPASRPAPELAIEPEPACAAAA